ncbi:unnamed protein product [Calypogeia fissa]
MWFPQVCLSLVCPQREIISGRVPVHTLSKEPSSFGQSNVMGWIELTCCDPLAHRRVVSIRDRVFQPRLCTQTLHQWLLLPRSMDELLLQLNVLVSLDLFHDGHA